MTNARCLTEGVDVPAIDCVMFADPKQSRVDIVQATGRALRHHEGKDYGYIVVPLVVPEKMDFEQFAETTAFKQVAQTITALSTQDERIADEFRAIERGRVPSGKIVEIEGDIPVGMKMKLGDFAEAISTRVWESVGRANWRSFEDARKLVRKLGLKNITGWREYRTSGKKPADIPAAPDDVYAADGWAGWGDWFGTGTVASFLRQYRSFAEARTFVRSLELKSGTEWSEYCKSGKKPADIPSKPDRYDDWAGMDDWLGTEYRSFIKARTFARSLGLKSFSEWRKFCNSGNKPADIPTSPRYVYARGGWSGMSDWLGNGRVGPGQYRSFDEARAFVRALELRSYAEWLAYKGKLPNDVPKAPDQLYSGAGWAGYSDWLGNGRVGPGQYRSFDEARAFVRGLSFKSATDWRDYCASGKRAADIPSNPNKAYARAGWLSWGDWLGTGRIADGLQKYLPFEEARKFARSLNLKDEYEWRSYCKSGMKPANVPAAPAQRYAEAGWAGVGDWLGTGRRRGTNFRSFKEGRIFARRLKLKSYTEWTNYLKSGKLPRDIPAGPNKNYASDGWSGWGDWLGYVRSARRSEARSKKATSEAAVPADAPS